MIDFPASPTDGQIFSATNGVVYKWSATYSSWLAQNPAPPLGGTGDFQATHSVNFALPANTNSTITWNTVQIGNASNSYVPATGRWTPPAGRYVMSGVLYGNSSGGMFLSMQFRKNGVALLPPVYTNVGAGLWGEVFNQLIVDANGADWFDMQGNPGAGTGTQFNGSFSATPLTGMQGPTGGAPGPVVGDFMATHSSTFTPNNSWSALALNTVLVGNSGGYYSTSTGRWTPPAGRYRLSATLINGMTTAANDFGIAIGKNGTMVYFANATTAASGYNQSPHVEAIVDANGTDYFDCRSYSANNTGTANARFEAFPLQGMVGPQGPPGPLPAGALSLYQEVVLSANAADMRVNVPAGAKKIELEIFTQNVGGVNDVLLMRAMVGGVPNTSAGYNTQLIYASGTGTPAATQALAAFNWSFSNAAAAKVTFRPVITSAQCYAEATSWLSTATAMFVITGSYHGAASAGANGFQVFNSGGTQFLPGSFLRVYVVP